MAMIGQNTKFAYVLDGNTHNLLIGSNGGFGAILGFSDRYNKEERTSRFFSGGTPSSEGFLEVEMQTTEVRMGLGFQSELSSGGTFELSAGGSYLYVEEGTKSVSTTVGSSDGDESRWKSDPGFVLDGAIRAIPKDNGFMLAAAYQFTELNPEPAISAPVLTNSQRGSLDFGWQVSTRHIDDLALGFTATYERLGQFSQRTSGVSETVDETVTKTYRGGLFLSADHNVIKQLHVRGGIQALATFLEREDREWRYDTGTITSVQEIKRSSGQMNSPVIFLGAGYQWKSLILDVRVRENIDLNNPFIRWAATVLLN